MTKYTVTNHMGFGALLWQVRDTRSRDVAVVAYCFTKTDAERIARALDVWDDLEAEPHPSVAQSRHRRTSGPSLIGIMAAVAAAVGGVLWLLE